MRKKRVFIFIILFVLFAGLFYQLTGKYGPWGASTNPQTFNQPLSVTPIVNHNKVYTQLPDLLYDSGIQSMEKAPIVSMGTVTGQTIYVTDTVALIGDISFTKDVTEENSTSETLDDGIIQIIVTKPDLVFDVAETGTYFYMITLFVPEEIAIDPSALTLRVKNKEIDAVEGTIKQRGAQAGLNEWTAGFFIPADDIDESNPVIHCQLRIGQEVLTYIFTEGGHQ